MGGKGKGNSFEREMNRELSLWFTSGKRDDIFTRTNSSGGRFTMRRKAGKDTANQSGDCTFADPIGEPLIKLWSIEFKTGYSSKKVLKDADGESIKVPIYEPRKKGEKKDKSERKIIGWKNKKEPVRWGILDFLDSHKKETVFEAMWRQCQHDAEEASKMPILIFRRNGRPACIAMTKQYRGYLENFFGRPTIRSIEIRGEIRGFYSGLSVMNLKDFFGWIPDISPALPHECPSLHVPVPSKKPRLNRR